jgi:hypothetical protein
MVPVEETGYRLSFETEEKYLSVVAAGMRTRENVAALTREVFDAALAQQKDSVLIDVRELRGGFGIMDIYLLVSDVFENLRGKGVRRAAIIDMRSFPLREAFLETAARNRGFNIRVFSDTEAAAKWLI